MRYIKHKIWCNAAKLYKIYIIQKPLYKNNGPEGHMIWEEQRRWFASRRGEWERCEGLGNNPSFDGPRSGL
jgi:hypothetical protein